MGQSVGLHVLSSIYGSKKGKSLIFFSIFYILVKNSLLIYNFGKKGLELWNYIHS
jgi:hypothetical protein